MGLSFYCSGSVNWGVLASSVKLETLTTVVVHQIILTNNFLVNGGHSEDFIDNIVPAVGGTAEYAAIKASNSLK